MEVYINNKTGKRYRVTSMGRINATNAQEGQIMVDYVEMAYGHAKYCREISEFKNKFTKESSIGIPWENGGMD